ncbi:hypothetical protein B0A55_10748 [Friedmanniomyces simplex]|uniref:Rhodopsin domain-containing protein n=1 Tax=Friedmanniomyces simplex TaxID=329884 RepID=A0A4U0WUT2_9PEZI|nr:hypothetical protein B0A55_10748 [Friedmanniomyces simplex]
MSAIGRIPPGQHKPFATVTKDDHGAGILIATAMGIAFTLLVLMAGWKIQGIVASFTEAAIFAAPIFLVWRLQKSRKIRQEIVVWFAMRLLVVILTGTRLKSFDKEGFKTDPTLHEATYVSLTQAELSYSIIAATIPVARTLVTDLITYYNGGGFGSTVSEDGSRGHTYPMNSLKSSAQRKSELGYLGSAQNRADRGDSDAGSQELIIRKDTTVQISGEEDEQEEHEISHRASSYGYFSVFKTIRLRRRRKRTGLHDAAAFGYGGNISTIEAQTPFTKLTSVMVLCFRDPMPKTDWYQVANSYGEQAMVALIDEAPHRVRRKMLAQPYSKTSMRRNQRWIDAQPRLVRELHSALDKLATAPSDTTNFFDLAYAWAVDSISEYLFGASASLHLLADIARASRTRQEYDAQRTYQFLPLPTVLLNRIGYRPEISWIRGMQQSGEHEVNTVFQHLSQGLGITKMEQKTTATATGSNEEAVASAEMQDHMIAGIDTVDLALTACAWELSLPPNQAWQHRLHQELYSARCPTLAADLETLPTLDAIIKEVLRLHVPLAGAQPRITPKSTILGPPGHEISVPVGVTVHSQAQTLHRSPAFKDAERFDPGRWLDSPPEVLKEMERWYWPFGSGPRACIGAQLGTDNFKLAVATLYGSFRTEPVEGSTLVTKQWV